jgi:hypothetical protein
VRRRPRGDLDTGSSGSAGQGREGMNDPQRDRWDRRAKIATVVGTAVAAIALVVTCVFTLWSVNQSAYLQIEAARLQAHVAAMAILDAHQKFAADNDVTLMGERAAKATASDGELKEVLVAQHGLLTANLVYDLTENSAEHAEMRDASEYLLERYHEHIAHLDYPCGALDDEFVYWARNVVNLNPCQGPNRVMRG